MLLLDPILLLYSYCCYCSINGFFACEQRNGMSNRDGIHNFQRDHMGKLKNIFIIAILAMTSTSYAEVNSRGFECVKGLCISDNIQLDSIRNLPWEPINPKELEARLQGSGVTVDSYYKNTFPTTGAIAGSEKFRKAFVIPYILNKFDRNTIDAFGLPSSEICKPIAMNGSFRSTSGFLTRVKVEAVTGRTDKGEYGSGLWVTEIHRCYTGQNPDSVFNALKAEYPYILRNYMGGGDRQVFDASDSSCPGPSLILRGGIDFRDHDQFSRIPGCKAQISNGKLE
jgi:hypothetical protein